MLDIPAGSPAIHHYTPRGSVIDVVPAQAYAAPSTYVDYDIFSGATDNFLEIFLDRLVVYYGLTGFAAQFTMAFEAFLQSVDLDDETPGLQPYTDPLDNPILTLADVALCILISLGTMILAKS